MDSSQEGLFSKKSELDVTTLNGDVEDDSLLFQHLVSQNTGNDENVLAMWDCANFDETLLDSASTTNKEESTAINEPGSSFDNEAGSSTLLWNFVEQLEEQNEPTCYPDHLSSASWPLHKSEEVQSEDSTLERVSVLPGFETLKRPFLRLPESTKMDTTQHWVNEGEYKLDEFINDSSLLTEEGRSEVATSSELMVIKNIVNEVTSTSTEEARRPDENHSVRSSTIPAPIRRHSPTLTGLSRQVSPYPPRGTWQCDASQAEPYTISGYSRTNSTFSSAFNVHSDVSGRWDLAGLLLDSAREKTQMETTSPDVICPPAPTRPTRSKLTDILQSHHCLPIPRSGTSFRFQTSESITSTKHFPASLTVSSSLHTNGANFESTSPFYTSHPLPALFESASTTTHDDTIVISSASEDEN
ncbi:uncharacterized protein LOC106673225 isoform X2 [Cimex lectularius]|uniref:Uncharacterized protein n=1 Tax=Cimex lectularius TaxID=79782 RepID=A0A8I6SJW1_CIMLE|nr:uncharacterized protein LOC106673225 isoform X2 [Cimex lectularius]